MKKLIIIGLVSILLSGCEYGGNFNYIIDNKSDYEFKLYFRARLDMGPSIVDTTLVVSPQETYRFHTVKTVNAGSSDFQSQFLVWYDTISLKTSNNIFTLTKDFRERDNWTFSSDFKKYGAESEYLFTIENKDVSKTK
jgi:hypothetical protein